MEKFKYSSVFGDLVKNVQLRFDAVTRLHKQLYDNVFYEKYFTWDFPTIGMNFEEIKGKYNVTIAAATIDQKSKAPVLGTQGLETIQEKVLTHSLTLPMTIDDYRKVLQILDSKSISDDAAKRQLIDLMWGNTQTPVKGIQAKLDIITLGALSNEGVATLDDKNNPEGGVRTTIDYNMPDDNKADVVIDWTKANLSAVDVFEDIQAVVDAASEKVVFEKILLSPAKLSYILMNKKLKQVIFGKDKDSSPLLVNTLNDFMRANKLPYFETIRRECLIQNNGKFTPYNPWNAKNLVFVPSGNLGVIKNAYANSELKAEPGVAYSNYGRIRVSQWGVGETQNSNGVEFVKAESLSLPVITEINGVYSLNTEPNV
jgi:hypothetical protein